MQLTKPYIIPQTANGNPIDTPVSISLPLGTQRLKLRGDVCWLTGDSGQINLALNGTATFTGGFSGEAWNDAGSYENPAGPDLWNFFVNPYPNGQPSRSRITLDALITVTEAGLLCLTVSAGGWVATDAVYFEQGFYFDAQPTTP